MIAILGALFSASAAAYSVLSTKYTATALMLVKTPDSDLLQTLTSDIVSSKSIFGGRDRGHLEKALMYLASEEFFTEVARGLRQTPEYGQILSTVTTPVSAIVKERLLGRKRPEIKQMSDERLGNILSGITSFDVDRDTAIAVRVTLRSDYFAARVANFIVDTAIEALTRKELAESNDARAYLVEKRRESKNNIDEIRERFVHIARIQLGDIDVFSETTKNYVAESLIEIEQSKAQLQKSKALLRIIESSVDDRIERAGAKGEDGAPSALAAERRALEREIVALTLRRDRLTRQGYSRSSRSVLDLNVEIEKLTGSLARLAKAPRTTPVEDDALIRRNTLRLEIEEIERYIEMRETALEKILRRGTRDPGNKYKIEELVRQADVEYGLLMELQKQLFQIDVLKISLMNKFGVVERASQTRAWRRPHLKYMTVLGGILGIALGCLIALALEHRNPVVFNINDLSEIEYTFCGTLPVFNRRQRKWSSPMIDKRSQYARSMAFKYLRTRVMQRLDNSERVSTVISVHSALPREGKTFISKNLYLSIHALGKKAILVDADILGSQLANEMGETREPGLTEVLSGETSMENAVRHLNDGESFIPPGGEQQNTTELFSAKFDSFLMQLRREYEVIIVDTPPTLLVPDAMIIAKSADMLLFSINAGVSRLHDVEEAITTLSQLSDKPVEVILNRTTSKLENGYGSYGARAYLGTKRRERAVESDLGRSA